MNIEKFHKSQKNQLAHMKHSCSAVNRIFFDESVIFLSNLIKIFRTSMTTFEIDIFRYSPETSLSSKRGFGEFCWILKK